MHRKLLRRIRWTGLVLAIAATLAPAATAIPTSEAGSSAQPHVFADLRSPDARDAGGSARPTVLADLRSPDARDALPTPTGTLGDRRAPDTRDLADGRVFSFAPSIEIVRVSEPASFDWGDAGIGAGAAFALIVLALGAAGAVRYGRRSQLSGA